jgi:diguanylate cyclase (GGDEF)-like protein
MLKKLRHFSGGIFRRQFFALFGTTIFFFGFTCFALLQGTGRAIIDRQMEVSSAYRDEVRSRVVDWLSERVSDIEYFARSFEDDGRKVSDSSTEILVAKLARFNAALPLFREVILVSPEGMVLASKGGMPKAPTSVADRDYFKAASSGHSFTSGLLRGRRTGSAEIAISASLRPNISGHGGSGTAIIVGFLALESVSSLVDDVSLRNLGQAFLIDEEGRVVSAAGYAKAFKELGAEAAGAPIDNLASRELRAGRQGVAEYFGYGGSRVVGAFARLEPIGLGLVVELSLDRALRPVTSILESGALFLALALVLLALVSAFLSARLVSPIKALTDAAEALIRDKDYEAIGIRTGTELDQLVELFNRMAAVVREREEGLRESAARDSLTGLYNHGRIEEFLDIEIRRKRRSGEKVAFVMLDIDFFKLVNDNYGHLAGDEVLRGIARMLEDSVRGGDIAGRYGGEEFSIILDARSDEEVLVFCERIRKRVEEGVFESEGESLKVTVSLGWTRVAAEGLGPYDIVRRADRALYMAKETGRNKVLGHPGDEGLSAR